MMVDWSDLRLSSAVSMFLSLSCLTSAILLSRSRWSCARAWRVASASIAWSCPLVSVIVVSLSATSMSKDAIVDSLSLSPPSSETGDRGAAAENAGAADAAAVDAAVVGAAPEIAGVTSSWDDPVLIVESLLDSAISGL